VLRQLENLKFNRRWLFGDLTGFDAPGAYFHPLGTTVNFYPYSLKVRLEPSQCFVMGVADIMTDSRFFSAYFANLCHFSSCMPVRQLPLNINIIFQCARIFLSNRDTHNELTGKGLA
jgi:hypothetical protein